MRVTLPPAASAPAAVDHDRGPALAEVDAGIEGLQQGLVHVELLGQHLERGHIV
jgi:hypothetical protein